MRLHLSRSDQRVSLQCPQYLSGFFTVHCIGQCQGHRLNHVTQLIGRQTQPRVVNKVTRSEIFKNTDKFCTSLVYVVAASHSIVNAQKMSGGRSRRPIAISLSDETLKA